MTLKQKVATKVATSIAPPISKASKPNNGLGLLALASLVGIGLLASQSNSEPSLEQELQELIEAFEKKLDIVIANNYCNQSNYTYLSAFTFISSNYSWCILDTEGEDRQNAIGYLPRSVLKEGTKAEQLEYLLAHPDFIDSFSHFKFYFEYNRIKSYNLFDDKTVQKYIAAKLLTLYWQKIN